MRATACLVLSLVPCIVACTDDPPVDMRDRVLVFTRATGVRHDDALAAATQTLPALLAAEQVVPDFTEDPALFTEDNLDRYRAVIYLYTSGNDLLDSAGKLALERFVRRGGGWLGIHSAAETETAWPFYKSMVVVHAADQAAAQPATVTLALPGHAALRNVAPEPWVATDEWYNFASNPRAVLGVDVLLTVDETTYSGGTMGADHPIAWVQERLIGRVEYTALGHAAERWQEDAFKAHIASGIRWVTGLAL